MHYPWLVVIPPLLVLTLAFTTHRIVLSLFLGILSATFIFHDFSIVPAIKTALIRIWEKTDLQTLVSWDAFIHNDNLFIYLFLIMLGIIITIISVTGATRAYGTFVQKKLRDRRAAETSSLFLSLLFFIDDYLNVLMVGSIMPPVTDQFKVPRIKVAFFANAFSTALCIIIPFSTWGAYILRQIESSGISTGTGALISSSPLKIFVLAIPFAFYSFIIIAATFFIVRRKISYGPIYKYELIAEETGDLHGGKIFSKSQPSPDQAIPTDSSMIDFLLPIITLVVSVFIGLIVTNFSPPPALFIGGFTALAVTLPYFLMRGKLKISQLGNVFKEGFMLMASSLVLIALAWTFGGILTKDLATGEFLASKLLGTISISLLPILCFLVSTITTLTIGSAWGSLSIIIPIAIQIATSAVPGTHPLALSAIPVIIPVISAVLAGAASANGFSPIADIVVMASTCTRSHHIDHVKAQQLYIAPVFFGSCVAFFFAGQLMTYPLYLNAAISLIVGIAVTFGILFILNKRPVQGK